MHALCLFQFKVCLLLQVCSPWMRTLFLGTVSRSLNLMERKRARMVSVQYAEHCMYRYTCVHDLNFFIFKFVSGSLSEDAPPPSRGMAVGQGAYSSRQSHPMALARSLPVSVPVWGCRGSRAAQGDSNSGERVSTSRTLRPNDLTFCVINGDRWAASQSFTAQTN